MRVPRQETLEAGVRGLSSAVARKDSAVESTAYMQAPTASAWIKGLAWCVDVGQTLRVEECRLGRQLQSR